MAKICAVIPAFNEQSSLETLIKKIKMHNIDVIIIDDGSTDETARVAEKEADFLIKHSINKGKGASLRDGFSFAIEKGYDEVLTLDADGQHNPDEIPLFINKIRNSDAAIIIGNRLHFPKNMPPDRLFVNRLFSGIVSIVSKQHIPDALSGFRLIKKEALKSITLNAEKFDIDAEVLIKASKAGFKIDFINIESIYDAEVSQIRPAQDAYRFFRLIAKSLFDKNV